MDEKLKRDLMSFGVGILVCLLVQFTLAGFGVKPVGFSQYVDATIQTPGDALDAIFRD